MRGFGARGVTARGVEPRGVEARAVDGVRAVDAVRAVDGVRAAVDGVRAVDEARGGTERAGRAALALVVDLGVVARGASERTAELARAGVRAASDADPRARGRTSGFDDDFAREAAAARGWAFCGPFTGAAFGPPRSLEGIGVCVRARVRGRGAPASRADPAVGRGDRGVVPDVLTVPPQG